MNFYKFLQISISFFFLFCIVNVANAAVFYLSPGTGSYHVGDTFLVEVRLDTEGEYINVVEANLVFNPEVLEVRDLSQGNSILALWIEKPRILNNTISFVGGTPGGYQGVDGMIGKIIFKPKAQSAKSKVKFSSDSRVLLNDGKGTEASLTTKEGAYNILAKKLEIPEDEWQKELEKDKNPPQPFEIEIIQDPLIFEGKYFIIFSTTDKETGIDHYEVKEGKKDWKIAISPYVLENQKLFDDIWVKAIDKAGNEWIEIIKAPRKSILLTIIEAPRLVWRYILYGLLILIALLVIIKIGNKIKKS